MTMINKLKLAALILFFLTTTISCKNDDNSFKIKIINHNNTAYGYQIIKDKRIVINQPYIPAVSGTQFFKDSLQAKKTANLVIKKLGKYKFPTVNTGELDSMKIDYLH